MLLLFILHERVVRGLLVVCLVDDEHVNVGLANTAAVVVDV